MPHITIEYSANLEPSVDVAALVDAVHSAVLDHGAFQIGAIRTRAARRELYRIADGDPDNAFVHVELRIGPGRDIAVQRAVAKLVMDAVVEHTHRYGSAHGLGLSVEISHIDDASAVRVNNLHKRLGGDAKTPAGTTTTPGSER